MESSLIQLQSSKIKIVNYLIGYAVLERYLV